MKFLFFITLFAVANPVWASQADPLRTSQMPRLKDGVLKISGPIDSHIYDALAYMQADLTSEVVVELNSWGGSTDWALEIARKIRSLGLDTSLPEGHVCASACVYLFSAGKKRFAASSTWFGIHGARLGKGFLVEFQSTCFEQDAKAQWLFNQEKKNCSEVIEKWEAIAMDSTLESFAFLEAGGVSSQLRTDYLSMEEDPNWPLQGNIIKIRDWKLQTLQALEYNLVTDIL